MLEDLLKGKVALITGAARGIGKAIAMKLASAGADIAFTDLKEDDNFKNTVAEIKALGVECRGYASNAADFSEAHATVDQILKDFGHIDVLVNNAGITRDGLMMRMSEQQWDSGRSKRQCRAVQLFRIQGRPDRSGKVHSQGDGLTRHQGQRYRAWFHYHRYDQCLAAGGTRRVEQEDSSPPWRYPRGYRQCGFVPRFRPVLICDGPGHHLRRRHALGEVLK